MACPWHSNTWGQGKYGMGHDSQQRIQGALVKDRGVGGIWEGGAQLPCIGNLQGGQQNVHKRMCKLGKLPCIRDICMLGW